MILVFKYNRDKTYRFLVMPTVFIFTYLYCKQNDIIQIIFAYLQFKVQFHLLCTYNEKLFTTFKINFLLTQCIDRNLKRNTKYHSLSFSYNFIISIPWMQLFLYYWIFWTQLLSDMYTLTALTFSSATRRELWRSIVCGWYEFL